MEIDLSPVRGLQDDPDRGMVLGHRVSQRLETLEDVRDHLKLHDQVNVFVVAGHFSQ
jgi:hypothetical protein